jgi:hypothetical protein
MAMIQDMLLKKNMTFDSVNDVRMRVARPNGSRRGLGTPIIDRRIERGGVNRLKREITSLKRENQNLRQELIELLWEMQQQKMKILAALGESTGRPGTLEGFFLTSLIVASRSS